MSTASPLVVVLTGSSGAGKGTQARFLRDRLGFAHIDVGQLLRDRVKVGDEFGQQLGEFLASGKFIPDDLANAVVHEAWLHVDRQAPGIVVDGYPRSVGQAEALRLSLNYIQLERVMVVWIQLSDELAMTRLFGRGRGDDTREAIQKRLDKYHADVIPAIEFLGQQYLVEPVDGAKTQEAVHQQIVAVVQRELAQA